MQTGYDAREETKDCAVSGRSLGVVKQPLSGICYAVIITDLIIQWTGRPMRDGAVESHLARKATRAREGGCDLS